MSTAMHGHVLTYRARIAVRANRRGWVILEIDGRPVGFPVEVAYELSNRLTEVAEGIEAGRHKTESV